MADDDCIDQVADGLAAGLGLKGCFGVDFALRAWAGFGFTGASETLNDGGAGAGVPPKPPDDVAPPKVGAAAPA